MRAAAERAAQARGALSQAAQGDEPAASKPTRQETGEGRAGHEGRAAQAGREARRDGGRGGEGGRGEGSDGEAGWDEAERDDAGRGEVECSEVEWGEVGCREVERGEAGGQVVRDESAWGQGRGGEGLREEARGRDRRRRLLLDAGGTRSGERLQMDLAGGERGAGTVGELDEQSPVVVDAGGAPVAVRPCDLAAAQRVAGAPGIERLGPRVAEAALERGEQRGEQRLDLRAPAAEGGRAGAQLGGQVLQVDGDVDADAEHRPALLGAPLDEDARELREPRWSAGGGCRWAT